MENKLYLIYLYNFEKKTYIDQRIHFNNEKDAVNYCFMNNICINLLSKDRSILPYRIRKRSYRRRFK